VVNGSACFVDISSYRHLHNIVSTVTGQLVIVVIVIGSSVGPGMHVNSTDIFL